MILEDYFFSFNYPLGQTIGQLYGGGNIQGATTQHSLKEASLGKIKLINFN